MLRDFTSVQSDFDILATSKNPPTAAYLGSLRPLRPVYERSTLHTESDRRKVTESGRRRQAFSEITFTFRL